ncbi:hypothetical protein FEM03_17565 [Phragmitibacter flavus]|uniref:Uncharacterized protein n=1 Tax=Phragmitibacter flavus TaxID=2576071 RepID=A0A5R8KAX0_9BACT|nr:hypothetical protein [Phragmitibacter flavus]TLD69451.1 hypothetical protein FEM03_17565 [Phragmitibacter flavus]
MKKVFSCFVIIGFIFLGPISCAVHLILIGHDIERIGAKLDQYGEADWSLMFKEAARWHQQLLSDGTSFGERVKSVQMSKGVEKMGFPAVVFYEEGFVFNRSISGGPGVRVDVLVHPKNDGEPSWQVIRKRGVYYSSTRGRITPQYVYLDEDGALD